MNINQNTAQKKVPEKGGRFLKKKIVLVFGTVVIVAIAGIISGLFLIFSFKIPEERILYASHPGVLGGLDPLQTWVPPDIEIMSQVAEGLFTHEKINGTYQIIHNLAINHSRNENATEYVFELRENVYFHDGTLFNASAVQWNIDRIYNLIDLELMHWGQAQFWLFDGNGSQIINRTEIIDGFTIKLYLNRAYVPLPALLASSHSYILSPTSTPGNNFIDSFTGDLVGTGPFIFDSWTPQDKVIFTANPNYWNGKPKYDKLIFKKHLTSEAKYGAILTGDINMYSGYSNQLAEFEFPNNTIYNNNNILESYLNNPNIIVQEGQSAANFLYLLINNHLINMTMRKAISYAFNYSGLIDSWLNGHGVRPKSIIPEGILYSNNSDIVLPYYNITIARQTLKNAGWNGTSGLTVNDDVSPGNEWESKAESISPIAVYNFTYIHFTAQPVEMFPLLLMDILSESLKQIGIRVEPAKVETYGEYYDIFFNNLDRLELTYIYFFPKFSDPSSIINILCSNKSTDYNYCQINDNTTQDLMEVALGETDEAVREQLYDQIQKHLIEEVFPMCYLFCKNNLNVYGKDIKGVDVNPFCSIYKDVFFN
jgi:peptide/nickel transport system substrate-binding protein